MAGRSYSRFKLEAWTQPEWRALTSSAQRLYMLLLTQPTLTAAGCLPRQPRKWAQLAADTTVESIEQALAELAEARYVLLDDDTEEVLIRTFIHHDGWVANVRRAKAVESAVSRIESTGLRAVASEAFEAERPKPQVEGTDQAPCEVPSEGTSEDNSSLHTASGSQQPAATVDAAVDLFVAWRVSQGDITNPNGFRKRVIADDGEAVAQYLSLRAGATALDAAVDVLHMPRPRPRLVEPARDAPCERCEGAKNIETEAGYVQCPECAGSWKQARSV